MKFTKGDIVKFKNKDSKYSRTIFTVESHVETDDGHDLVTIVDQHGRILTAVENSIELLSSTMG